MPQHPRKFARSSLAACWLTLAVWTAGLARGGGGQLELTVVDRATGKPIPCRVHLTNQAGRPRKVKRTPFWHDHFVVDGRIILKLPKGNYAFELERGPEYVTRSGHFTIHDFAEDTKQVDLRRFVDMSAHGWWSGDLHVGRSPADMELLMLAEDLHVVPVVTWSNTKRAGGDRPKPVDLLVHFDANRYYHVMAGTSTWPGGELLYFNLPRPLRPGPPGAEHPSPMELITQARKHPGAWIDSSKAFWWDLPMLVALGGVDSVQIAHSHLGRQKTLDQEAHGKPRDRTRFPGPWGNAQWTQEVYFRLLECGLRIPPTAGSGSGFCSNPLGYNRMYVHVDSQLTYSRWWENLRAGRVTITNGPLLRPRVGGALPGHVFKSAEGPLDLEIALTLSTRQPISYLEVIRNGAVEHSIPFAEYRQSGRLPKLHVQRSGWFLVRAVADLPKTYRFAMTGPYYVQIGGSPRISKAAVQFFLDWLHERARQIGKITDPDERREVLGYHRQARDFWQDLLQRANAE